MIYWIYAIVQKSTDGYSARETTVGSPKIYVLTTLDVNDANIKGGVTLQLNTFIAAAALPVTYAKISSNSNL
jgi:hypothetical protein